MANGFYTSVIDLTQSAQNEARRDGAPTPFDPPDPARDEASVETLPESLQQGVRALGWPALMPVQEQAVPYILHGQNLVVQSRTGSGKTGAFLLPLLKLLDSEVKACQAIVLCPTRELAKQILGEFDRMNAGLDEGKRLRAVAVYGGVGYGPQIDAFKKGAQLVVSTPGRLLDHLSQGTLRLDRLRLLILDEADEMLSMGFYPDMRKLKRYLPSREERDSYMFSATMPYKVQKVAKEFLRDPAFISLSGGTVHVDVMSHRSYKVDPMEKDRVLVRLIEMDNPDSAIIFANTRREVDYLSTMLNNFGYDAGPISSDFSQKDREKMMGRLRDGKLRFLVATDVAARGIDVSDLSHVYQYDVPQDPEYYIHRAGRTARAGKTGVASTLITPVDEKNLVAIARRYDIDMERREIPTDAQVAERVGERVTVLLEDRLRDKSRLDRERIARFEPLVRQLVDEGEPEVLAMLLDEVYRRSLHDAPAMEIEGDEPEATADDASEDAPREEKKGRAKRKKRRRSDR